MTQQTDFRVLCAELLSRLEESDDYILKEEGTIALADRARAALAQPSDVGLLELMPQQFREDLATVSRMAAHGAGTGVTPGLFRVSLNTGALDYARAVLARYGHQPAPSAVGEGVTDDEIERRFQVWWYDEGSGMPPGADEDSEAHVHRVSQIAWHNGAYVARFGHQPAPAPAEGEVAKLVARLRAIRNDYGVQHSADCRRAADLLEQCQAALVPVPVSERLPGPEDCDEKGRCWLFSKVEKEWRLIDAGNPGVPHLKYCFSHWLPATSLPLPQGEVE